MHPHILANDNPVAINFASFSGVFASSIETELPTSNHIRMAYFERRCRRTNLED